MTEAKLVTGLARASIESYLIRGKILPIPEDTSDTLLTRRAGAFVTLYKEACLRGCIGTIQPTRDSLAAEIIYNAIAAASQDPRFPPVDEEELDQLVISVDVLGTAEPVDTLEALDPDRYGVIVSNGYRRGLLLPGLEGIGTVEEQVSIALQKAGIPPGKPYRLERFEVIRHEE